MAKKKSTTQASGESAAQIISYRHADKRKNNPEVGIVTPATDPEENKTRWAYDPHIDPALQFDPSRAAIEKLIDDALASGDQAAMVTALQELKRLQSPYLNWAGKAERTSFDIDTVSLHVHERVDPASILAAVHKVLKGEGKAKGISPAIQPGLFDAPFENIPLREAIDFYRHERGGDSLLVMNSLLQKESMAGKVQMIYIDPPYGIKYGSNFQPFTNKRDVKDRKDEDLTQEPEMIKAFRDTWELGIHSYLTYLRDRLLLARELLNETGGVFVQISDSNVHIVRNLIDEIFGADNFVSQINFRTAMTKPGGKINNVFDYILWYAKDYQELKFRPIFVAKENDSEDENSQSQLQASVLQDKYEFSYHGIVYNPINGWRLKKESLQRLVFSGRTYQAGLSKKSIGTLKYTRYVSDFPLNQIDNTWNQQSSEQNKTYVVQTAEKIISRCILMTTDPGDLVLDPTCGSGTTAFVAEKWGRRWITCDTSRIAVALAKQRLMTASYDYFSLRYPHEGLKGGFIYKTVPHVTLKSIANSLEIDEIYGRMHPAVEAALAVLNAAFVGADSSAQGRINSPLQEWEVPFDFPTDWPEAARKPFDAFHTARQSMQKQMDASIAAHADQETLYDQPQVAKNKLRITGPFTVEAVPFPSVKGLENSLSTGIANGQGEFEADTSIARTGESGRQHQWREELLKAGIRGKNNQMLKFAELETLPYDDCIRNLHAVGHLDSGERVVVSFGPEHAALEQRQVANAMSEAGNLFPLPRMIVFCAFAFDPEAAKDIDQFIGIIALKAQMNTDLLTEDLKKAKSSNQSFWLMGQPEVEVRPRKDGKFEVEVHGFDYFDTVKGELVSGGKSRIAMWLLDTDYDERSLFPRQVFFPMAGKGEGWDKLKKNIRAELNEDLLGQFHGTVSLPFEAGENRKIAVKIVDDRGIESLKVMLLP